MPFTFKKLSIPELVLIEPKLYADSRGFFMETYKYCDFSEAGIAENFLQDNYSHSSYGVLRGLHYQKDPDAQGKLVQCINGRIFDAAVDMRRGSATYGRWLGIELSSDNRLMLYVPPGFAHGFVVLSETADVLYKCTREYAPSNDRGIIWNDPDTGIDWPVKAPALSAKDKEHPRLKDADNNFIYRGSCKSL